MFLLKLSKEMGKNSKDISTDKGPVGSPTTPPELPCHLVNLNVDCLREISQYLQIADQFALMKTCKHFHDFFFYEVWQPIIATTTFDISTVETLDTRPKRFQVDFLDFILQHFARIKGISLEIFKRCMDDSAVRKFKQVVQLSIINRDRDYTKQSILFVEDFKRFPLLRDLYLEIVIIYYCDFDLSIPFHCLHIKRCPVKVFKMNSVYARYMEERKLRPLPRDKNSLRKSLMRWVKQKYLKVYLLANGYPIDDIDGRAVIADTSIQYDFVATLITQWV